MSLSGVIHLNPHSAVLRIALLATTCCALLPAATPETFLAQVDGYQDLPGLVTKATATFKLSTTSTLASLTFDLSFQNIPGTIRSVTLYQGQPYVEATLALYDLCGYDNGPRVTCDPKGYKSATLFHADILPYSSNPDVSTLLDLLNHKLVFIVVEYQNGASTSRIRGKLVPQ